MVTINVAEDCGNAPKKLFLRDFIVGIVNNDIALVSRCLTDDVVWNIVNEQSTYGKKEILTKLQHDRSDKVIELSINTIVTHGYDGVINGVFKFKNGKAVAFCDIYRFRSPANNTPIKQITTYAIALE